MHALLHSDAEVFFSPRHARITCAFCPSCFLLQCRVHYDLVLGSAKLTDIVAVYRAVMSQQSSLVNCGDYIELVSQQNDVRYFS